MTSNVVKQAGQGEDSLLSSTRSQEWFSGIFAMIAGFADAYAYVHYKTYVSFMSGNTTTVGSKVGGGDYSAALPSAVAIIAYVSGVFAGTLLVSSGLRRPHRLLFGIIAVLLAVVVVLTQFDMAAGLVCIGLLSGAMGLLNTSLSHVGLQTMNVVFVTGTLSKMATHFAQWVMRAPLPDAQGSWDTHRRRGLLLLGVWGSFLTGALVGGFATSQFGVSILLLPAVILVVLAVYDRVTV